MADSITIDFSRPIPVFPLPSCVLLPYARIPLHIFEPRYRKMIADALDSHGLIATACFDGDAWREDYEGDPPIRPVVCLGHVVHHERLPDGRYNILLHGVCRARIVEEKPHKPYRIAKLRPLEIEPVLEIDLEESRQQIETLLHEERLKQLASVAAIQGLLNRDVPTRALIDVTIMTVCEQRRRYDMLAEADIERRATWLIGELRGLSRVMRIVQRFEPKELDGRVHVN